MFLESVNIIYQCTILGFLWPHHSLTLKHFKSCRGAVPLRVIFAWVSRISAFKIVFPWTKSYFISGQISQVPTTEHIAALKAHAFYLLHVHLKQGYDLAAKDTNGLSDPYVKFFVRGLNKAAHKSKTVYKDLNPAWDERFVIPVEDPFVPVDIKVGAADKVMAVGRSVGYLPKGLPYMTSRQFWNFSIPSPLFVSQYRVEQKKWR